MKEKDFRLKIDIVKRAALDKILDISVEYSKANRAANIGDIVVDHYHRIKVKQIKIIYDKNGIDLPKEIYYGIRLRNDNKSCFKSQNDNYIYSQNIEKIIKDDK